MDILQVAKNQQHDNNNLEKIYDRNWERSYSGKVENGKISKSLPARNRSWNLRSCTKRGRDRLARMKGLSLAKNELTPSAKNRKEVTASLEKILNSPVIRYQQQRQQQR